MLRIILIIYFPTNLPFLSIWWWISELLHFWTVCKCLKISFKIRATWINHLWKNLKIFCLLFFAWENDNIRHLEEWIFFKIHFSHSIAAPSEAFRQTNKQLSCCMHDDNSFSKFIEPPPRFIANESNCNWNWCL